MMLHGRGRFERGRFETAPYNAVYLMNLDWEHVWDLQKHSPTR